MEGPDFSALVRIWGEDCDFDPVAGVARIYCIHCGNACHVDLDVENGKPVFLGFTCDRCGLFNPPD